MKITHTIEDIRKFVKQKHSEGKTVGLVPTMGYLHEGHASLIKAARKENDIVIVSVFVNPTQFGPDEDFESYPRDMEKDAALCEKMGADLIFNPSPETMYPGIYTSISMKTLTENLCGLCRPVHFGGVCLVLTKLFNIVTPDRAYFGQKDAQQLAIVRQMVSDLNFDIQIVGCPIVREEDGLAKSSRNTYMTPEERKASVILSKSVKLGRSMVEKGEKDTSKILEAMKELIESEPIAKIDYLKAVNGKTMEDIKTINKPTLFAMAVYFGKARLLDNFIVE